MGSQKLFVEHYQVISPSFTTFLFSFGSFQQNSFEHVSGLLITGGGEVECGSTNQSILKHVVHSTRFDLMFENSNQTKNKEKFVSLLLLLLPLLLPSLYL
jgi:hypothetical protein